MSMGIPVTNPTTGPESPLWYFEQASGTQQWLNTCVWASQPDRQTSISGSTPNPLLEHHQLRTLRAAPEGVQPSAPRCLQPMPANMKLCLCPSGAWGSCYWILGVHIPVDRGTNRLCQKEGMVCHSPWKTSLRAHSLCIRPQSLGSSCPSNPTTACLNAIVYSTLARRSYGL